MLFIGLRLLSSCSIPLMRLESDDRTSLIPMKSNRFLRVSFSKVEESNPSMNIELPLGLDDCHQLELFEDVHWVQLIVSRVWESIGRQSEPEN